jgi:hypothetical protein
MSMSSKSAKAKGMLVLICTVASVAAMAGTDHVMALKVGNLSKDSVQLLSASGQKVCAVERAKFESAGYTERAKSIWVEPGPSANECALLPLSRVKKAEKHAKNL